MQDRKRLFIASQDPRHPVVLILVDDDQTEVSARLGVESLEKTGRFVRPAESRQDEVDSGGDYSALG